MSPVSRDSCQTRSKHCVRSCPWGSKPDPLQQSWMPWRHAVPNSAVVSGPAPIRGTAGFGRSCRQFSGRICLGLDPWPKREDLACGLHRPRISGPPLMRPKKPLWRSLARSAGLCPYAVYLHGVWGLAFFSDLRWCWSLAKSYSSLAAPLRESLRSRFREKPQPQIAQNPVVEPGSRLQSRPFRHFVAAAPAGTVLSQEGLTTFGYPSPRLITCLALPRTAYNYPSGNKSAQRQDLSKDLAARWREIFNCPLTWHFSCAEVTDPPCFHILEE